MGWFMSGVSRSLRDGVAAAQARQFDRARPLLEEATKETPADPVGWFWLAIASPSAGAAMRCLRRALELDVTHEQARNGLVTLLQTEAQRLAAAGARAEARELALEATRLAPSAQSVWLSIAAITDDQKERLDALRKAVAITPDDAQLRMRLRQALLARGVMPSTDRAEARACFKEAAAINPNRNNRRSRRRAPRADPRRAGPAARPLRPEECPGGRRTHTGSGRPRRRGSRPMAGNHFHVERRCRSLARRRGHDIGRRRSGAGDRDGAPAESDARRGNRGQGASRALEDRSGDGRAAGRRVCPVRCSRRRARVARVRGRCARPARFDARRIRSAAGTDAGG